MEADKFIQREITALKGYARYHFTSPTESFVGDDERFMPILEWASYDFHSANPKYVVDIFGGYVNIAFEVNEEGYVEFNRLFGHTVL